MDNQRKPVGGVTRMIRQIRYDCSAGIVRVWYKFLPVSLVFLLTAALFYREADALRYQQLTASAPTLADLVIHMFQGMKVYDPSSGSEFDIPVVYLFISLYTAYLIGNYAQKDLCSHGLYILLRSKKRGQWWLSKCVWNVVTVLVFYLFAYLGIVLAAMFTGALSFQPSGDIHLMVADIAEEVFQNNRWVFIVVLMPILTSIALALLQMALSFFLKPVFSFIVIVCIVVVSAYYCSPFWIGNYSMLLRSDLVIPDGIPIYVAVVTDVLVITVSIAVGYGYIRRCDILDKQ